MTLWVRMTADRVNTQFLEIAAAGSFPALELPGRLEIWSLAGNSEILEVVGRTEGPCGTRDLPQPMNDFSKQHPSRQILIICSEF